MLGAGIDIVEVERVAGAVQRWGDRFLRRILTEAEVEACRGRGHFVQSVAARFAAKEAFFKAVPGNGARRLLWKDVEVLNTRAGRPYVRLSPHAKDLVGSHRVVLSLSHTRQYATAVVLID